jgi:hypothetical protein
MFFSSKKRTGKKLCPASGIGFFSWLLMPVKKRSEKG